MIPGIGGEVVTVLARNRKLAPTEFEMHCGRLLQYTVQRADHIPNRYKKFIRPQICRPVASAYHNAILANETSYKTEDGRKERAKLMDNAIRALLRMQKPLVVYWSLFDTKDGGIREWVEMTNREIALLNGAASYGAERMVPMIETFEMSYSDDRMFINAVRTLHKFTYTKICSVPLDYKDYLSDEILTFVDEALFCTLKGNRQIPTRKKQYEIRDKYFRRAIDNLNGLQRPLYALWNVMEYSENTMDEWAEHINEAIRLLQGVRKSDKRRFWQLD